jgi:hypothetical protein
MLFIVRGKDRDKDRTLRVHAETAEQAEAIGWKRGLFVVEVTPADQAQSSRLERISSLLWRNWRPTPADQLRAFGQRVSRGQAAALLLLGCVTWCLDLKVLNFI